MMARGSIRRLTATLAMLAGITAGAAAQQADVTAADRAEFERLIAAQIAAFQRDDEAQAFAYASPGIQATFGTPRVFMQMVREGYQPVYRPREVRFGAVTVRPWGPEQRIFVIGPDGHPYVAVYPMERQPDGSWRINGCYLETPHSA